MLNFMKIRPMGTELYHANGQTDVTKIIVASCNFSLFKESTVDDNIKFTTLKQVQVLSQTYTRISFKICRGPHRKSQWVAHGPQTLHFADF
jgi:hypothetical protein